MTQNAAIVFSGFMYAVGVMTGVLVMYFRFLA